MSTRCLIILVDLSISHRYVRTHGIATLTIWRFGALFKTRIADISVDFKPNEFVDDSTVGLEGYSPYLPTNRPSH